MRIRFATLDDISRPRESERRFLAMPLIFGVLAGNAQGNLIQRDVGSDLLGVGFALFGRAMIPAIKNNDNLPIECLVLPSNMTHDYVLQEQRAANDRDVRLSA